MAAKKVSKAGKVYYTQASPEDREGAKFVRKVLRLRPGEGEAFDQDAATFEFKSAVAYFRHLWDEDRKRRGLPERVPPKE